jgi:predicted DCC family thiol-disulfide oxidoreductase YuxK
MNKLTVLYDAECGFCVRCRWWLIHQPKYVEMNFCPAGSPEARERFPELWTPGPVEELVVVDDEGGVYRGTQAWLMCLWALVEYREYADWLSHPALMPLARGAFATVSASRKNISALLGMPPEEEILEEFRRAEPPRCAPSPGSAKATP